MSSSSLPGICLAKQICCHKKIHALLHGGVEIVVAIVWPKE
jgi:hypothetical protein